MYVYRKVFVERITHIQRTIYTHQEYQDSSKSYSFINDFCWMANFFKPCNVNLPQTESLGTANWGLSFPASLSLFSWEQSCEELHFFLSSAANCCCWLDFRPDRPQPAVKLPRREKALITIGDEGTLLGLRTGKHFLIKWSVETIGEETQSSSRIILAVDSWLTEGTQYSQYWMKCHSFKF